MQKRNIGLMVLWTILTFGIYMIVWTCSFQNQLKKQTGKGFGGAGHLAMLMFTFGIYGIYWQFAAGKRLAQLGAKDYSVIYLLLQFFAIGGIINPFLMQLQANKV